MKSKALTLVIFLIAAVNAAGQTVFTIEDGVSGTPLGGATVTAGEQVIVADETGSVRIPANLDSRRLIVRFVGYESREVPFSPELTVIRLYPDYLVLHAVTVKAYQEDRPLTEVAGSYTRIPGRKLPEGGPAAVVNAVSAIPGVRMEQRSPGSYRINIRGSTLRSPFGVRNVKIYYNQIPVTEPNGNTPLNLLDLEHLSSISVIRSPAASMYGAGTGGVLFLSGDAGPEEGFSGEAEISGGSFDYRSGHLGLQYRTNSAFVRIAGSAQSAEGYRDHTALDRKNVGILGEFSITESQKISYMLLYNDIFYELPGGLTEAQRDEDPTQARQIAIDQQSSIDQGYLIAGLSHHLEWAPNSGNETSLFFSKADKVNPFITNYEFEDLSGYGLRTRFFHELGSPDVKISLSGGGEWQWGRFEANNFGNSGGFPDTLRYVDDTRMFTGFEYVQATLDAGKWHLTAGICLNHLRYDFNRMRDVALDSAYKVERAFENRLAPRVGVVYDLGNMSVFANVSSGYSPPTQDEVRTSDGNINSALEAEEALSIEAGIRSTLIPGKLTAELIAYRIIQDNTIASQVDELGNSIFTNSGQTLQQGLEMMAMYGALNRSDGFLQRVELQGSLSLNDLSFREYSREAGGENIDLSGNDLTGGVPFTWFVNADLRFASRIRLNISVQYTDRIPLNDLNTVYSRAYHLMRARIGKQLLVGKSGGLVIFAGADNLLNEKYSLGNDLNAFGGRYFNPSATRNYYGGIRWEF